MEQITTVEFGTFGRTVSKCNFFHMFVCVNLCSNVYSVLAFFNLRQNHRYFCSFLMFSLFTVVVVIVER